MIEFSLPQTHPEYCPQEEIEEQALLSRFALERDYQDRCALLRADYVELFIKHDALSPNGSFALFVLDEIDSEGGVTTISSRTEVLIIMGTGLEDNKRDQKVADIRVVTNQYFGQPNGVFEYLTKDFTLDEDNDAQYSVGVFSLDQYSGAVDFKGGLAPLFFINDSGKIKLINFSPFTQAPSVESLGSDGEMVKKLPFGIHSEIEHKIAALEIGRELLDEVRDHEPRSCGPI